MARIELKHPFEDLDQVYIRPTGPSPCDILLVGESGGFDESQSGYCFTGKTGQELDGFYLPLAHLRRGEVRVNNVVPAHPIGNRNPTKEEIEYFSPLLEEEIASCCPKVIVAMGYFATQWFLGPQSDVGRYHGIPHTSKKAPDSIILPTYHPAAGLHNNDTQALIAYDFQQIRPALIGTLPPRAKDAWPDPVYVELTTSDQVWATLAGTTVKFMGVDTEGYKGNPWGLSFAVEPGIAYVIRFGSTEAVKAFGEWIRQHPATKVVLHNALHDLPILREMGVFVLNYVDTMVYAYCLGGLEPQGLKDLSYRFSGVKMQSYEDVTGPAMRRLTTEYLIRVAAGDWGLDPMVPVLESDEEVKYRQPTPLHKRALRAINDILGRYSGVFIGPKRGGSAQLKELGLRVGKVNKHVAENLPKGYNAWDVDVPVPLLPGLEQALSGDFWWDLEDPVEPDNPPDSRKRWSAMQEDLEESVARCEEKIGTLPETGLDAIEDQQVAIDYSAKDADTTLRNERPLFEKIKANGLEKLVELDMSVLPFLDEMQTAGIRVNRLHMLDYGETLKVEMRECQERIKDKIGRWINPQSPLMTAHVVYDMLGFPVEMRTGTGQPSTADKVLESLAPLDKTETISEITLYRELSKLRSTYAMKLPRWTDEYSRCHPRWKYTRVASGRLSTADPNLLAIPVRSERGNMIRAGFRPEDGHVFVGVDLSQIEVRVTAEFSRDPALIAILSDPNQDFHTATAAAMWGKTVAEIDADTEASGGAGMRASAKNVSFGILYGVSASGLQWQLKSKTGVEWTVEQCQDMIDRWLEQAYPHVKYYMERMKYRCRRQGYVESMFKRRRYLPGVHSTIPRIREEAYRAAINHPIQSSASEIVKLAERKLVQHVIPMFRAADVYIAPVLQVHDEVIFEVDTDAAAELEACIIDTMESVIQLCVPLIAKGHTTRPGEDGGTWAELK